MKHTRFYLILLICFVLGAIAVSPVFASHGYLLHDVSCDPATHTITIDGTASHYPASGYWINVFADGVYLGMYSRPDYTVPNGAVVDTFTNPAITYGVTIMIVAIGGPVNVSIDCMSAVNVPAPIPEPSPRCPIFHDGRLNHCDTFAPVVLYGKADANDNWGLDIYAADESGLLVSISPDVFASVADCPTNNTLLYNEDTTGLSLYRLAQNPDGSCPYQLNAPATEAGKVYILIFDELFGNGYYVSFEE